MRPEKNPLDLNNLPEDFTRDGKQVLEDTSSSAGYTKKKSGAKDGKDECGKVYECRFCSLKFCKSQALGGHMNRHRQERETETLNRARQLVFGNDNLLGQGPHHLSCGQPIPHGGYHQTDPTMSFRPVHPTRLFSGSTSNILPSPPQPYMYTSPPRLVSYPLQYIPTPHPVNDHFVGHVLSGNTNYPDTNYTCIGAPVKYGFTPGTGGGGGTEMEISGCGGGGGGGGRDMSLHNNQEEALNWGTRAYTGAKLRLDPSSINRFQDGF